MMRRSSFLLLIALCACFTVVAMPAPSGAAVLEFDRPTLETQIETPALPSTLILSDGEMANISGGQSIEDLKDSADAFCDVQWTWGHDGGLCHTWDILGILLDPESLPAVTAQNELSWVAETISETESALFQGLGGVDISATALYNDLPADVNDIASDIWINTTYSPIIEVGQDPSPAYYFWGYDSFGFWDSYGYWSYIDGCYIDYYNCGG